MNKTCTSCVWLILSIICDLLEIWGFRTSGW